MLIAVLFSAGYALAEKGEGTGTAAGGSEREVLVVRLQSVINPVSADYLSGSIEKAQSGGYEAIIVELDTPGGLDPAMRKIIKSILSSEVPVAVYVSPPGARAASAGAFITIAAHVAAMAPQTNIGAAHPVSVGAGGQMDETMKDKVTNDAVAYIKALAGRRDRNVEWAAMAVRNSVSASETEALEKNVIDFISNSPAQLLGQMDGMKVETVMGERELDTAGASLVERKMGLRHRILNIISDPNIAYILMILGFYGIFFELTNPGAIFPGILGGICLILAFFAFQTLPVNYAGVLLIIIGIVMLVLEINVVSYGALTMGGIIAMVIGSLMLFESPKPFMRVSLYTILPTVVITVGFVSVALRYVVKAQRGQPVTGSEGLVGMQGTASTQITFSDGQARVHGETWSARLSREEARERSEIEAGERIEVVEVEGLTLRVKRSSLQ